MENSDLSMPLTRPTTSTVLVTLVVSRSSLTSRGGLCVSMVSISMKETSCVENWAFSITTDSMMLEH